MLIGFIGIPTGLPTIRTKCRCGFSQPRFTFALHWGSFHGNCVRGSVRGFTPRDFQRFAADMAVNSESFAVAASLFPILSFVSVLFLVSTNRCSVLFLAQRSVVLAAAGL